MSVSRIWELLARKYNHEISDDELRELELLLQQHQDAFQLNELMAGLHDLPLKKITSAADEIKSLETLQLALLKSNEEKEEALQDDILPGYKEKTGWGKRTALITGIAASVMLVLALWLMTGTKKITGRNKAGVSMNEVVTNGGSKSTVHLPDGSSVIINTGSKLTYNKDFGVETREIFLKGEAFFDIVKNEQAPLVVHAGNVEIKVKGTIFNVKAYVEDSIVEASLIEGAIEVFSQNDPERKILMRPNEKIIIGKSATISSQKKDTPSYQAEEMISLGKIKPNPVDSSIAEIAWIENKLAFYKEPFLSLAKKMERWYNVSIDFRDSKMEGVTFTGSFEKEDIVEALNALRQSTPFHYTIENRNIIISRQK
ncbi:MAG: FecR family protein [Chitinophagaceae bacterium]|nr:FecR family protein [Chitinophagaceae bacterium]